VYAERAVNTAERTQILQAWPAPGSCFAAKPAPNCRNYAKLAVVDVDELQHALGGIVLEAAYMERVLRMAFSALIGSKYGAVVDGRLMAAALIEDCERMTRYHTGIPESAKSELLASLNTCREANRERNRVIHDTWAARPGNEMVTLQGGRASHEVTVTARTLAEVRGLADEVAKAADGLAAAMTRALGATWMQVEDQLRQELGRDVRADPGPSRGDVDQ
jgi:hypothetical protein